MVYGEAICSAAAEQALLHRARTSGRSSRVSALSRSRGVAEAYCVCVVDGEDAAEGQTSAIHNNPINEDEFRLLEYLDERGLD